MRSSSWPVPGDGDRIRFDLTQGGAPVGSWQAGSRRQRPRHRQKRGQRDYRKDLQRPESKRILRLQDRVLRTDGSRRAQYLCLRHRRRQCRTDHPLQHALRGAVLVPGRALDRLLQIRAHRHRRGADHSQPAPQPGALRFPRHQRGRGDQPGRAAAGGDPESRSPGSTSM